MAIETTAMHSALPWRATKDLGHVCIRPGQTGWLIAQLREASYDKPGWGDDDPSRCADANADLIVRAVNNHAALLAALKAIVEHQNIDGTGIRYEFDWNSPIGKQARAAIAAAEADQ